jgi:hypothetical protein
MMDTTQQCQALQAHAQLLQPAIISLGFHSATTIISAMKGTILWPGPLRVQHARIMLRSLVRQYA